MTIVNCAHGTGFTINLVFSLSGIVLDIISDFLSKLLAASFDLDNASYEPNPKTQSS